MSGYRNRPLSGRSAPLYAKKRRREVERNARRGRRVLLKNVADMVVERVRKFAAP
jgi:hypothetical protein